MNLNKLQVKRVACSAKFLSVTAVRLDFFFLFYFLLPFNLSVSTCLFFSQLNWTLFCATLWSLRPTLANMKSDVSQSKDTRYKLIFWQPIKEVLILFEWWRLKRPLCQYKPIKFFFFLFLQIDFVQDRGPVCHSGLHLDPGSVPDQSLLSGPVHHPQLPAGHLPLHRPLSAKQRGTIQI